MKPLAVMPFIILGLFGLYTLELGVVGILPLIVERYHVTIAQAGLLMSIFALVVAASGPFLVLLSSRIERRKILTWSLFCFSVCSVLSAFAPNYATLMALRILPAMLHPVFFSAAFAAAVSLYPREKAAHATTLAFIGTTLGLVFGVPLTTLVADLFSYEAAILFCGLATLLAGIGLLLRLPRQTNVKPLSFGHQLAILRRPSVWLAIAATVLVFTTKFAVYSYAAEFLKTRGGLDVTSISVLLLIFGVGGVLGNLLAGRMLASWPVATTVAFPVLLAAMYAVLFALGGATLATMAIVVFVWGGIHTSGMVITQTWLTRAAPEAHEFATSLYVSFANAGIAVGAWIGGVFIESSGLDGIIRCGFVFAALSLVAIAAKAILYGAGPYRSGLATA
jgi:predicted MFS family arabinose efflux permease